MFRFLRSLHIAFQSVCTSLHSHQQCMRVPFSWHAHQHQLLVVFLMIAVLTGVSWNLSVVLICISFMARDDEHFSRVFLAIWISSFEKGLFSSVAHFLIGSLIWGEFSFLSSLYKESYFFNFRFIIWNILSLWMYKIIVKFIPINLVYSTKVSINAYV
jgi:hypothetical protein